MSKMKVFYYLTILSICILLVGYFIAGYPGLLIAFIIVLLRVINSVCYSKKLFLRMYPSREALPEMDADLLNLCAELSQKANVAPPKLYIFNSNAVNGFSIGKNQKDGCIVLTSGLIQLLDKSALRAVMAYLILQIKAGDSYVAAVAGSVAHSALASFNLEAWKRALGLLSHEKATDEVPHTTSGKIITPLAAFLMKPVLSVERCYALDSAAANLCEDKNTFQQTLTLLEEHRLKQPFPEANLHPASVGLFVSNPLRDAYLLKYFDFFPTVEKRISRLQDT